MNQIWLEKYRPKRLSDMIGNNNHILFFQQCLNQNQIINMLLSGSPGTGKTTTVYCMAYEYLQNNMKDNFMELNASDERGVDVVRDKIRQFANKKVQNKMKIILLDEADSLTESAQISLRVVISEFEHDTRFILSCNESSKIIEPLQSKLLQLHFDKLQQTEITNQLLKICSNENIVQNQSKQELQDFEQSIDLISWSADGDMRKAINNLEAVFKGAKYFNKQNVTFICDLPDFDLIYTMIEYSMKKQFEQALIILKSIFEKGYNTQDLTQTLNRIIVDMDIPIETQFVLMNELAELKMNNINGFDGFSQFAKFIVNIGI